MVRLLAALPVLYFSLVSLAQAVEEEQPVETSSTGIIVFVVASVICIVIFGWYMWKNEKKPDEEKLGDKF